MQEFSSISVSSYEAGALAGKLTEQSGDGWSVVAIVPTGSTVTAYLSRPAGSKPAEPADAAAATATAKPDAAEPDAAKPESAEPAEPDAAKPDAAKPDAAKPDATKPDATTPEPTVPPAASSEHVTPALPERETAGSPVDEPAGWALQPESANAGASGSATPASTTPATAASTTAAASAAAAPAGWYADPSSRYDLRYWDGSQWTEHVSRGGQQFSDPPVA